jgi:transcriptional regulator with XRE-family HTH domain
MPTPEEKAAFSKRLEFALRRSADQVQGATELALRFNLRYQGNAVSAQTAHKWLTGRAIPTSDKLATLAEWLNVNPHWLHYGPAPSESLHVGQQRQPYGASSSTRPTTSANKSSSDTFELAAKIQSLPPHRRYLVEELIDQLLRASD